MSYDEFCSIWIPLGEELLTIATSMLSSRQEAEDALQDLYIKLWLRRETLDNVYNPAGYATRVLKNLCIDRIRKAGLQDALPEDLVGQDVQPVEQQEEIKMISDAILKLPDNQRKVLEMRTMREMSYKDISEETGMSRLTLRVLLSKARKTLRKRHEHT